MKVLDLLENDIGICCVIYKRDFDNSRAIMGNIKEKIKNCLAVIVLLTDDSVQSDWIQYELDTARKFSKDIFVFELEPCTEIPNPSIISIPRENLYNKNIPDQLDVCASDIIVQHLGAPRIDSWTKNVPLNEDTIIRIQRERGGVSSMVQPRIQIIGWDGIRPPQLYSGHAALKKSRISFLTTELSLEILPRFSYLYQNSMPTSGCDHGGGDREDKGEPEAFDVIYVDNEFCERYFQHKRIKDLYAMKINNEVGTIGDLIGGSTDSFVESLSGIDISLKKGLVYGVPIQFGFHEVLAVRGGDIKSTKSLLGEKLRNKNYKWRHEDFDILKMVEDKQTHINLWHWYLPTMTQMYLSYFFGFMEGYLKDSAKNISFCVSVYSIKHALSLLAMESKNISADDSKISAEERGLIRLRPEIIQGFDTYLSLVRSAINENIDRVSISNNMNEVRKHIRSQKKCNQIVIGVGSSPLHPAKEGMEKSQFDHVQAIIPKQGVAAWLNCAAITTDSENPFAANVIENWLNESVQMEMFRNSLGYVGLPTTSTALMQVRSNYNFIHAVSTLNKIEKSKRSGDNIIVAPRTFPNTEWGKWISYWEQLTREVRSS